MADLHVAGVGRQCSGAYAAYILQVPVLLTLAIAARPCPCRQAQRPSSSVVAQWWLRSRWAGCWLRGRGSGEFSDSGPGIASDSD